MPPASRENGLNTWRHIYSFYKKNIHFIFSLRAKWLHLIHPLLKFHFHSPAPPNIFHLSITKAAYLLFVPRRTNQQHNSIRLCQWLFPETKPAITPVKRLLENVVVQWKDEPTTTANLSKGECSPVRGNSLCLSTCLCVCARPCVNVLLNNLAVQSQVADSL